MDFENTKRVSFLIVFLFLKMNPLNYDLSPCCLAGERDKTCINKFSSMLKVSVPCRWGLFSVNWVSPAIISQWQNQHLELK